jgi:hypothetical protein
MSARVRAAGFIAGGIHLALVYKDGSWWHKGRLLPRGCLDSRDFYKAAFRLLLEANPTTPVLNLAVSCFDLHKSLSVQLEFFTDVVKNGKLVKSIDDINQKWGDFTIGAARSLGGAETVLDRIAFGGVKELEEITLLDSR